MNKISKIYTNNRSAKKVSIFRAIVLMKSIFILLEDIITSSLSIVFI